jgi:heat-inducible transcriptional repressor
MSGVLSFACLALPWFVIVGISMRTLAPRKPDKDKREGLLLLGLVELYLKTGKPVGSNTLRENGFESLSSATIRNYFVKLEEAGFLKQQHSSGGRIPTSLAYKHYAEHHISSATMSDKERYEVRKALVKETREIASYLQQAAEFVSEASGCSVVLSAPRFDQDFILDIKLVGIDSSRCLCVVITDFGLVHTETLYADKKLSNFTLKRIEGYLHWKLTGLDKPKLNEGEEEIAQNFYNELMLRHIVGYTHFSAEDLYKTGFSKLLNYPDFNDASALASGLALFENQKMLRTLLDEASKSGSLSCWIGEDLNAAASACSMIAVPYRINQTVVGAVAILGPTRVRYKELFALMRTVSDAISESLTKSMYKFKLSFRKPSGEAIELHPPTLLLEKKEKR